ncbi:MAG: TetR/AcrR family transcriptional regulator [Beijerinckiaceae bacterium]
MRMTAEQKARAKAALIDGAGRVFRENGAAGIGVDGLARASRQTSGALYAHFSSKEAVLEGVVAAGVQRLAAGAKALAEKRPADAASLFAERYLAPAHRDDVANGCLLPALTADVARSGPDTRRIFAGGLAETAAALDGAGARGAALALLALVSGAIALARAVDDPAQSDAIRAAARHGSAAIIAAGGATAEG